LPKAREEGGGTGRAQETFRAVKPCM
jgi:hypothetical protein